jgi:hypothetical protein
MNTKNRWIISKKTEETQETIERKITKISPPGREYRRDFHQRSLDPANKGQQISIDSKNDFSFWSHAIKL